MAEFTRGISSTIRKMGEGANYMQMGICTLESLGRTKNMGKVLSIGLVFARLPALKTLSTALSSIMGYGGAVSQMAKAATKKQMVYKYTIFRRHL